MIFFAIDLDNENHAEKPNIQAKFVIHKIWNTMKARLKSVKRFATKVGEKWNVAVDVNFK